MNLPGAFAVFLVLLLILASPYALAQQVEGGELPDFSSRTVPGESVIDLADFVSDHLAGTGMVPEYAQVETADGNLRTISAVEIFTLLARSTYLWRTTGNLPEAIPIAPDQVSPPVLDPQDAVAALEEPELGRDIRTESFLAQCQPVIRWVDRLQVVPTAVWVEGERLSAAEYLAGLAICLSYAYWEGELYETIFIGLYAPPQSWIPEGAELVRHAPGEAHGEQESLDLAEAVSDETAWSSESEVEGSYLTDTDPQGHDDSLFYEPEPRLVAFPDPGTTVTGRVDVVAHYSGPPARFVIFTFDGKHDVIINYPPYSFEWDTSDLEPGSHTVRIQVLGDTEFVLADQVSAYSIVAPPPTASLRGLSDGA